MALVLSGCASQTQLAKVDLPPGAVLFVDNRSAQQRARKHDALFSAVVLYEDDKFNPKALEQFEAALVTDPAVTRPVKLEVDEFRIGDFYPVRLGAGGQGALGAALFQSLIGSNTDWNFVSSLQLSKDADALFCVVVGRVNGKPIKVATSERYKVSVFAGLIANDPDYRRALDAVIKRAAAMAIEQSKGT